MAKFEFNESGCTFIPDKTRAKEGKLREFAEDFDKFMGRITGRSGDLHDDLNNSSHEFNDLIAWKITNEAEYDQSKWREAVMAISFLIATTREWADAVEDYKDARETNIEKWKHSEKEHLKTIEKARANDLPAGSHPGPYTTKLNPWVPDVNQAIKAMRDDFNDQRDAAKKDWSDFQEKAEEISGKLKQGATEENVRKLQEAGYLTWAPFNIMGAKYDKPDFPTLKGGVPKEGSDPKKVNAWWEGLTPSVQEALKAEQPDRLRMMDGIPAAVRDELNREHLTKEIPRIKQEHGEDSTEYKELDKLRENLNDDDSDAYLLGLDTSGEVGRAIVSEGNPDTAANVANLVPGTDTDWMSVNGQHGRASRLKQAADVAARDHGETPDNAVISWIGYDAPSALEAPLEGRAKTGAEDLVSFQEGLKASHEGRPANTTVIGHSYGSTVVGHALQKTGTSIGDGESSDGAKLDVDSVIAVGSPGMGAHHVSDLDIPSSNVHVSQGADDWIAMTPVAVHGTDPSSDDFGATVFDSSDYGHSDYFNKPKDKPMSYMGGVIAGIK
ncbi:hypothetical protein CDO52_21805 [Nocardiopsis gilva YIM 90087]|uniref:DUF1023 domain-containing protein n=1 Tax=Nocardiopsis gilva YIM 90087 TaxID=1235441 RepID=A0A223SAD2_9ACTN|nr:alpha/beta hydrolase [Nocardiopsis gilva]ASU85075.1 hypothetical protein CDO52_21805 [Nocardiopsis gilva YIM 90087]